MKTKVSSEYEFRDEVDGYPVSLTLYINYINKTYDFMQGGQEGIFPSTHNKSTAINKAYFKLGLEVLDFVEKELFSI